MLLLIGLSLLGFWFGLRFALRTDVPLLAVTTKTMCTAPTDCNGFLDVLVPTLHVGDLVVLEGTDAGNLSTSYPNSDVVVFHEPQSNSLEGDMLVITRIVNAKEINGTIYFQTKGDREGSHFWPDKPIASDCQVWNDYRENYTYRGMISEKLLIGKVAYRIPWIGYLAIIASDPITLIAAILLGTLLAALVFSIRKHRRRISIEKSEKTDERAGPKAP